VCLPGDVHVWVQRQYRDRNAGLVYGYPLRPDLRSGPTWYLHRHPPRLTGTPKLKSAKRDESQIPSSDFRRGSGCRTCSVEPVNTRRDHRQRADVVAVEDHLVGWGSVDIIARLHETHAGVIANRLDVSRHQSNHSKLPLVRL